MGQVLTGRRISAYLLLILLQGLLAACDNTPPEQAIKDALAEIETAIEDGDAGTVMDRLSDDIAVERRGRTLQRKTFTAPWWAFSFVTRTATSPLPTPG